MEKKYFIGFLFGNPFICFDDIQDYNEEINDETNITTITFKDADGEYTYEGTENRGYREVNNNAPSITSYSVVDARTAANYGLLDPQVRQEMKPEEFNLAVTTDVANDGEAEFEIKYSCWIDEEGNYGLEGDFENLQDAIDYCNEKHYYSVEKQVYQNGERVGTEEVYFNDDYDPDFIEPDDSEYVESLEEGHICEKCGHNPCTCNELNEELNLKDAVIDSYHYFEGLGVEDITDESITTDIIDNYDGFEFKPKSSDEALEWSKYFTKLCSEVRQELNRLGYKYTQIDEDLENKESETAEETVPETFDDQMDFLAADEQEAIDGYEKVIDKVEDEHVQDQLEKIETEEQAHKDYLEKVKEDPSIDYEEPLMDEESEEAKVEDELTEDLFSKADPDYYGKKAWMLNQIISGMNDETAYYDTEWLYVWPDGETYEECLSDFNDEESFKDLEDTFISIYKYNDAEEGEDPEDAELNFHRDGLYNVTHDAEKIAHEYDKQLGLEPIKVLKYVNEELKENLFDRTLTDSQYNDLINNTTYGSVLSDFYDISEGCSNLFEEQYVILDYPVDTKWIIAPEVLRDDSKVTALYNAIRAELVKLANTGNLEDLAQYNREAIEGIKELFNLRARYEELKEDAAENPSLASKIETALNNRLKELKLDKKIEFYDVEEDENLAVGDELGFRTGVSVDADYAIDFIEDIFTDESVDVDMDDEGRYYTSGGSTYVNSVQFDESSMYSKIFEKVNGLEVDGYVLAFDDYELDTYDTEDFNATYEYEAPSSWDPGYSEWNVSGTLRLTILFGAYKKDEEELDEVWSRAYFADTLDSAQKELNSKGKALTHYAKVAEYFSKRGFDVIAKNGYFIIEN